MRFTVPAYHQAARYQLDNAGSGSGGPWVDPFDDPTGTVLWSRWINGSTSGTAKDNCSLWSNKLGFLGPSSACEWRTNSGTGRANVELLNWQALSAAPLIVRMRCKVETYAVPKVWLLLNLIFTDPIWEMYVDVTPDGTTAAIRVGHHSPEMVRCLGRGICLTPRLDVHQGAAGSDRGRGCGRVVYGAHDRREQQQ